MESSWKNKFIGKLEQAQNHWLREFESAVDKSVTPAFDEFREFLSTNGFSVSRPLKEEGRRSFKFELAENAYLLVLFRSAGVGEFEIRAESFVPGQEPVLSKAIARVNDLSHDWVIEQFQTALDNFVGLLSGQKFEVESEELIAV
ncbi:MAG: hypothetical protein AB7N71_08295 [Phycisphaerae bacterium]